MKRMGLFLSLLSFCLLAGCGAGKSISGQIVEVGMEEKIGLVSFVVKTDGDQKIGILMTDETLIFSFADGMTADKFQAGSFDEAVVTVECGNTRNPFTMKNGEEITAYHGERIQITGYSTGETATVADGTKVDIWRHFNGDAYILKDGTELLRVRHSNTYVGGIESFDDLEEGAREKVLDFYENQGLLYDVQDELEKAYKAYVEKEDASPFSAYMIDQDISLAASNETVMYFLTSVLRPIEGREEYEEYHMGAAFDRNTGEAIHNWALFSCPPEEARDAILDLAAGDDPVLRKEMERALQPENIIFFPHSMELYFQQGTLPSQESAYVLGLDYDDQLSELLHEWAIPQKRE